MVGAHSDSLRDYYTKSVNFGGRDVADSGFSLNGDVYLDVVISAKGATIEGVVMDSKSQPVIRRCRGGTKFRTSGAARCVSASDYR